MKKSLLLSHDEINLKLERIAWQILENHVHAKTIVLVGLIDRGADVANKLKIILEKHTTTIIQLTTIHIDKKNPLKTPTQIHNPSILNDSNVILVDDVLNSGITMAAALKEVLNYTPKSVMTAVLANRDHNQFPIQANFVGLSLATTLKEHILYEEIDGNMSVYLL